MENENEIIESLDPKDAILEALKILPGQRASDLAIELDFDKKEINRLLYRELKDQWRAG